MLQIQLETTSTCQAACHFCVYSEAKRWGGLMTMDLYEKIIDESSEIPEIDTLVLHGLGEATLDPHIVKRVKYAHDLMPNLSIEIYTNGVFMFPARLDALRDAGLSTLVFSLNAVNQKQHRDIMGLIDRFDTVCENIDYALLNRGDMNVEVHAVINGDRFTKEDGAQFNDRWKDRGARIVCVVEGNWSGDNRTLDEFDGNARPFKPNECCSRAISQIYVMYDGRISACCFDPTGKIIFGDLNKQTIKEIYGSEKYLGFRVDHFKDMADLHPICAGCTRI